MTQLFRLYLRSLRFSSPAKKLSSNPIRRILVMGWEGKDVHAFPVAPFSIQGLPSTYRRPVKDTFPPCFSQRLLSPARRLSSRPIVFWYPIGDQQSLPQASRLRSAFTDRSPA